MNELFTVHHFCFIDVIHRRIFFSITVYYNFLENRISFTNKTRFAAQPTNDGLTIDFIASIYTLSLCLGHSWRVRLAKQETLTPPGHLVSPLVCRGPWKSAVVLYCWCHSDSASVVLYFTLATISEVSVKWYIMKTNNTSFQYFQLQRLSLCTAKITLSWFFPESHTLFLLWIWISLRSMWPYSDRWSQYHP